MQIIRENPWITRLLVIVCDRLEGARHARARSNKGVLCEFERKHVPPVLREHKGEPSGEQEFLDDSSRRGIETRQISGFEAEEFHAAGKTNTL